MRSVIFTANSFKARFLNWSTLTFTEWGNLTQSNWENLEGKNIPVFQRDTGTKALKGLLDTTDRTADRTPNSQYSVNDEGFVEISFPFTFAGFTSAWVNSNSYITFGESWSQYQNFVIGSAPSVATLFVGAEDGGWLKIYEEVSLSYVRIRFEGSENTAGTPVNTIWEITFYNPDLSNGTLFIELITESIPAQKTSGVFGIGGGSFGNLDAGSLSANTNYVIESIDEGSTWSLHTNSYINLQ